MEKIKSSRITKATVVALAISILSASVYSSNEGAEQLPTASKSSATSNIDIDGNEEFDALTDGLLILRSMFGLTDSPLITGAVAGDALYVDAEDIQSRIEGLGNRLDIDNDGNIDALTDGLVTLRYLFGLTGDPLISGVIATGAGRVTAEDIEAYMAVLTSLDTEPPVFTSQETFTAPENQTAIGTVTATDANSPSIAFSISGSELSITSDGVLSFASAPDYETKTSYTATVTASDGTNLTTQAIVVSVSDVDEAPIMGVLNYTADENQTSIGSVVATDPEGEAVSLSVSGSELLITSDGVLTFASAPDYETKSSYTATVTATDGTNSTDQSVTVTVTDVDDVAPVFTSSATFSAAENQTAIDTVTATDVDTDNSSISFSVSGSELLITSAGVLTFASSPDYETKTSYSATVSATDGANSTKQDITVNVTNVNDIAPVFTSTNNFSVVEGQTAIGTVTATDAEGDDITFTISGTELAITSEGVLTFVSAPDYETKSSYSATLTASDGVNQTNQNITISITFDYEYPDHWDQYQSNLDKIKNEYTNPIGFNLDKVWFTTFNINKDKFSTTRFDYLLEDQYFQGNVGVNTWFTEGDATYYFNCNWVPQVPSEGATKIFKYLNGEFDSLIYQKNEGCNHPFSIKNKDGSYQHIFLGLDEGKLGTGSQPLGDTYTFNTQSGEFTNLNFSIGSHGQHVFDYEQDGDEDIISNDFGNIVASGNPFILRNDGENNFSVVMVPQPDFIETGRLRYSAMSAAAYYESGYLKVVYTDFNVSKELDNKWGIEAEKNVVVTYEPNDLTVVDVTQLPDPYSEENFVNLEYYNQSWIGSNGLSHDVRSTPIDIDYDGDIDIVIGSQVYGENISLPQILINNNGVFEDQTESRLFNWVFATGSIHRWDFADVNGDGYLDIITKDGCNNLIEASNGELIDLRPNGCELKVAVNDGTGHFISIIEPTHILQVFEGNEFKTGRILPIFAMDQNRNLSWVYADGKGCNGCYNEGNHEIFTVKLDGILNTGPNGMNPAIRGEPGFNEFYYLLHHTDAREAVSSGQYDNGLEHYIAVGKDLGYSPNAKSSTNVTVDSYSINPIHTVKSKYVNLVPSITSSATFSAAENQTAIGTVTATDVENDTLTYSIGGSDLTINSSSGVIAFASAPDYETKTSYSATVTATDGTNSTTQSITVNVTNVNDNSPVFTSNATFSAAENQTSIGTVTATDGDASDSVTFKVSGSELSITSAGVLTFASAPDYETKSSYTATITATDGTNSTDQSITVSVNDVNEAPAFTSLATFSADEKQTSIGTVIATDIENDTLTYSVTGTDASAVTVDSSTGVLTFNAGPDYETQSSYSVTAEVSDGSLSTTQAITISINETEFEVYGTAYASKYFVMDGDIPNTDYIANDNSNNSLSGAQSILNPTVVSGYTGHAGDTYDLFVVSTSSNMYVNLDVVDYVSGTKDLDIYIYNSDGSERDFSYVSGSTEGNETINLPNGGTYVIQVYPVAGSSPYLLTVGQRLTSSQASMGHGDFAPNEILSYIPFTPRLTQSSRAEHIARLSTPEIKKRVSDLKLPKTVLEHSPALRKIGSEFLINKFKKQLDADLNPVLKMSDKQKIYLSHWKAIQRLEEINPMANYELNYTVERMANFSADPLYNYQWNLRQINLEAALNAVGQEVKDVAVAVIDSGSPSVNSDAWNATDFIAGGYDFVASTSNGDGDGIDNDPTDPDASDAALVSHGVHVGTTIGMKNDGAGFNGMAVKVLPLRVFPETPEEGKPLASRYDIKEAILYAAGLSNSSGTIAPTTIPVKVINLSLGGSSAWDCSIFTDVAAQGITVVAASGNDGNETPGAYNYPASCTNVVSVGATDSLDQRTSYSQYNNMVDIAAPGGSEIDSDADGTADYVPAWGNNTQKFGLPGTSMASPQVAGAIALLYAIDTNMSPSTVNTYLQAGYLTDDIGASGYDTSFGYGRLNVAKAIENTLSSIGDTTTTFFSADTSYLNFGDSTNQLSITFSKVGNASLSVSSLSADDASGLSYSSSVDSNGAGTYTIYIDRSEVPNGAFQNRLYFNLSNSSQVSVSLYYEVGGARSRANLGKVFIGLYNSDDSLAASGSLAMDGTLSFVANDIVDGEYYFLVSSNNDDDGYVCDYGEFCARYPDTEGAQTFTVSGADLSGGEIYLDPIFRFGGINAASNMSQPSYNLDIAQPAGSASQSIFKVEALDSDGSEDESNTTIPEGTIPISPN